MGVDIERATKGIKMGPNAAINEMVRKQTNKQTTVSFEAQSHGS